MTLVYELCTKIRSLLLFHQFSIVFIGRLAYAFLYTGRMLFTIHERRTFWSREGWLLGPLGISCFLHGWMGGDIQPSTLAVATAPFSPSALSPQHSSWWPSNQGLSFFFWIFSSHIFGWLDLDWNGWLDVYTSLFVFSFPSWWLMIRPEIPDYSGMEAGWGVCREGNDRKTNQLMAMRVPFNG